MKSLNTKLVLSTFGIVAMLASPAFAQKRHHVTPASQSAVYNVMPGYDESGAVVDIPNSDRYGAQPQR